MIHSPEFTAVPDACVFYPAPSGIYSCTLQVLNISGLNGQILFGMCGKESPDKQAGPE